LNDVDTQLKGRSKAQNYVAEFAQRHTWFVVLYGVLVSIKVIFVIWMAVNKWG
jgi:hypothetical protein